MKTKHFFIVVMAMAVSAGMVACKGVKSVQSGSAEVSVPLSGKEYQTDQAFFRASQSGKSPDLATAKKIALQNAKAELAGNHS
jgi:hypothetical protein